MPVPRRVEPHPQLELRVIISGAAARPELAAARRSPLYGWARRGAHRPLGTPRSVEVATQPGVALSRRTLGRRPVMHRKPAR